MISSLVSISPRSGGSQFSVSDFLLDMLYLIALVLSVLKCLHLIHQCRLLRSLKPIQSLIFGHAYVFWSRILNILSVKVSILTLDLIWTISRNNSRIQFHVPIMQQATSNTLCIKNIFVIISSANTVCSFYTNKCFYRLLSNSVVGVKQLY